MAPAPLRILLVNRHMNIGGVETYLYRLCAGLRQRGHTVGLLTEGGLWEDKAVEAGAELHKVASLTKGWRGMLPLLRERGYQVVHGHNYHSARVARALAAELDAAYLMSVHGPRPRIKQLFFRDWSEEVVVMSEGDGQNIRWWGGVPAERITLSFYGIDTERFHPGIDTASLRTELGLGHEPVAVFISRFSNRKADVGHALLDALPALRERISGLRLLLVGEGPESEGLVSHIQKVNTAVGSESARMIGPRRDVERFMALGDVAICTANTALEAMACGTPTLAAGRTGYFGLVTPATFEAARALCFADHGRSPKAMGAAPFVEEMPALFADLATAKARALETAAVVAARTSVPRMAAQMEQLYRKHLGLRSA